MSMLTRFGAWRFRTHPFSLLLLTTLYCCATLAHAQIAKENRIVGQVKLYDAAGDALADHSNVVIFLEGDLPAHRQEQVTSIPKVSHKGKMFSPRVLPIVKGEQIDFYNDDSIYHNVFSVSQAKPFDLGIYPQGSSKFVDFERSGLVKLYCNIHPKMVSTILVLDNPFFATTLSNGKFEINGILDGDYILRVWHELGEEQRISISVYNGQVMHQKLAMRLTKKLVAHKNKFGKRYRKKY